MENKKKFNLDIYEGKKIEDMSVEEIKAFLVTVQEEASNALELAENTKKEVDEIKKYYEDVLKKLNAIKETKNNPKIGRAHV